LNIDVFWAHNDSKLFYCFRTSFLFGQYFIQQICKGLDLPFLWLLFAVPNHLVLGGGPHIYADTGYGCLPTRNKTVSTTVHIH